MRAIGFLVSGAAAVLLAWSGPADTGAQTASPSNGTPPRAAVRPVTDRYFGRTVVDPYRWLEDQKSDEVLTWLHEQDRYARSVLGQVPHYKEINDRVQQLSQATRVVPTARLAGDSVVYLHREPGRQKPRLQVRTGLTDRMLVDIEQSTTTSIDFIYPSPMGRFVAYGSSSGGTEASELRVLDVASGAVVLGPISRCRESQVTWLPDESGFFYARYPELPTDAPASAELMDMRILLHKMGTPVEQDRAVFGHGLPGSAIADERAYGRILVDQGAPALVAAFNHAVMDPTVIAVAKRDLDAEQSPTWRRIADVDDQVREVALHGRSLYVITSKNAPRNRLERWEITAQGRTARTVMFESPVVVLDKVVASKEGVYVSAIDRGVSKLFFEKYESKTFVPVALPTDGALIDLDATGMRSGALFRLEGWTVPAHWLIHDGKSVKDTGLGTTGAEDMDDVVVIRSEVRSHDGVLVPLTVLHRKGLHYDGKNPTWLAAYGSYGIPLSPSFRPMRKAWIERGGVFAFAHVRGGGELGEPWHRAGQKLLKPNSILDVIACAENLIQKGITSPGHLAVYGASAGGIVANGAIVRRPDLFAAGAVDVGDANMLRLEEENGGPQNADEFGTIATKEGFDALFGMDAYHQVKDGTAYPAMLYATGINDPRVPSWQSAKMAARLQAATSSNRPVLLRVGFDEGHGVGATRRQDAQKTADFFAFLLWRLSDVKGEG